MEKLTLNEFINDYGSATANFKKLSSDYSLELLNLSKNFKTVERLIKVSVAKQVVMFGLSITDESNSSFVDLLTNSGGIPIGIRLFEKDSLFKRQSMKVIKITKNQIDNLQILNYINDDLKEIYYRESVFVKGEESMLLKEYFLPNLQIILDNYNKNCNTSL